MNVFRFFGTLMPLAFVANLALGAVATAEEPKAPKGDMAEIVDEARRAREMGDLAKAIEGYSHAYLTTGDTRWLFTLGDVHREAGHDSVALKIFQTYLRRDPQGTYQANATRQVQELEALLNTGGRETTAAPRPVPATPPASAVAAPNAAPPSAAPTATATPAKALPQAPAPIDPAPTPGLDLSKKTEAPTAESEPPLPRWLPWALTAATVATGTAAVVAGLSASNHYNSLKSSCGQTIDGCPPGQIDDVRSRAGRANLLWVATGAVAAATGVAFVVNIN